MNLANEYMDRYGGEQCVGKLYRDIAKEPKHRRTLALVSVRLHPRLWLDLPLFAKNVTNKI